MSRRLCSNCGRSGHYWKDCPRVYCRNCNQSGHIARNCPNRFGESPVSRGGAAGTAQGPGFEGARGGGVQVMGTPVCVSGGLQNKAVTALQTQHNHIGGVGRGKLNNGNNVGVGRGGAGVDNDVDDENNSDPTQEELVAAVEAGRAPPDAALLRALPAPHPDCASCRALRMMLLAAWIRPPQKE